MAIERDDAARPSASSMAIGALGRLAADPARFFVLLYVAGFAIDLLFGLAVRFRASPLGLESDEGEYFAIASRMLAGTLDWQARRTLAFPALIAAIRAVRDDMLLLQVATTALYALSPPLLFLLARRLSGSAAAGALAGLLLAFWPTGIFYGTSLYSESVALPAFLGTLLLLPIGSRAMAAALPGSRGRALLCGLALAATIQIRPLYLLFTPFLCVVVLVEERIVARAIGRLALIAIGAAIVTLPWSIAMTAHFGHPILISSNGGETLAGGLNPTLAANARREQDVTGRHIWTGPGKWISAADTGYLAPAELALPDDRQDALLQARTRAWILSHPADVLRLEAIKLTYMWGIYPIGWDGAMALLLGSLPAFALLLAGIATLALWPAARVSLVRLWILPVFISAVALISWGSWRFRQPADAGLLALVAIAIVHAGRVRGGDAAYLRRQVKIEDMA